MAPMKLYGAPMSTCVMRDLAVLFEKEVTDFEVVPLDFMKGEHKLPEFLAKQPFGQVPVLEDGDLTIFESRAIARYICAKYEGQGTNLLGSTLAEKAKVDMWLDVEMTHYNSAVSVLVFELVFAGMFGKTTDPERVKEFTAKFEKVLDVYEAVLAKQPFIAGEEFSLADLSTLSYTHYFINVAKSDIFSSRPHVSAWWEKIASRPAWLKVLAML